MIGCWLSSQEREGEHTVSHPPDSSQFRAALKEIFTEAMKDGKSSVAAGDLPQQVGGYPEPKSNHRMPICCEVMYQEMGNRDEIMHSPQKGKGSSLTVRYDLPRGERSANNGFCPPVQNTDLSTSCGELVAWIRLNMKRAGQR